MLYPVIYCSLAFDWQSYREGTSTFSIGKSKHTNQKNLTNINTHIQNKPYSLKIPEAFWSKMSVESSISCVAWTIAPTERPRGHALLLNDKSFYVSREPRLPSFIPSGFAALHFFLKNNTRVITRKWCPTGNGLYGLKGDQHPCLKNVLSWSTRKMSGCLKDCLYSIQPFET